ncbi:MAG TPA: glycoside hydrolase 43 family protein [Opitutaceae bacterium]|nr:glycoside hydrolase 43 family protein [Opitutaceae bacterium]
MIGRDTAPSPRDASLPAPNPGGAGWVPDRGDGTYLNPVLFADYSDPDAIRVGDDYWLTASSFNHVPGLPILHSRDLVNWELAGHALPRLVPEEHYSVPRHGAGVWAPAIRFHRGRYWIYYPDPDFGLYVVTTTDPRGSWTAPKLIHAGRGLIDPCPFWDEDGRAYLVHGWAKSRSGICNQLTLHTLSEDGLSITDAGTVIVDGAAMPGWHTIEGPKLYRRHGYYYIFAPAGGVATGYQAVFRARRIQGPYEARVVLAQGHTAVNGPHQGAWVETPGGEHWFLHFQDRGTFGRVVHLQPMSWGADEWPQIGHPGPEGTGEPVLRHAKPASGNRAIAVPATSDDFRTGRPGPQWQWQANPGADWVRRGAEGLEFRAVPHPTGVSLWGAPALLLQKFPAPGFTATVRMAFAPANDGDAAGLLVFGYGYAWLGLRRADGLTRLVCVTCDAANEGGRERMTVVTDDARGPVWLRAAVDANANCQFSSSRDGMQFLPVGTTFRATVSKWVGAKIGLFARSETTATPYGAATFSRFEIA